MECSLKFLFCRLSLSRLFAPFVFSGCFVGCPLILRLLTSSCLSSVFGVGTIRHGAAGGESVERAMESAVVALFNLLTAVDRINIDPALTRKVEAKGAVLLLLLLGTAFGVRYHASLKRRLKQ